MHDTLVCDDRLFIRSGLAAHPVVSVYSPHDCFTMPVPNYRNIDSAVVMTSKEIKVNFNICDWNMACPKTTVEYISK